MFLVFTSDVTHSLVINRYYCYNKWCILCVYYECLGLSCFLISLSADYWYILYSEASQYSWMTVTNSVVPTMNSSIIKLWFTSENKSTVFIHWYLIIIQRIINWLFKKSKNILWNMYSIYLLDIFAIYIINVIL